MPRSTFRPAQTIAGHQTGTPGMHVMTSPKIMKHIVYDQFLGLVRICEQGVTVLLFHIIA